MTIPTLDCDLEAIDLCREMVNDFDHDTNGRFRELLEEIAMISGAATLPAFASFCQQIGLNRDWWRNELHIYPDGALVFIDCNDGAEGECSFPKKRMPDAKRG